MLIKRKSLISGVERELDLPVDPEMLQKWERGEILIQNAFPHLTPDQREFIMTGSTADEWDAAFADPEDDADQKPQEGSGNQSSTTD